MHTAGVTTGKVHDAKVMYRLIREDDRAVYGDKGYASDEKKRAAEDAGVLWAVKEKTKPGRELTKRQRARNRRFGKVRAKVTAIWPLLGSTNDVAATSRPVTLTPSRPAAMRSTWAAAFDSSAHLRVLRVAIASSTPRLAPPRAGICRSTNPWPSSAPSGFR